MDLYHSDKTWTQVGSKPKLKFRPREDLPRVHCVLFRDFLLGYVTTMASELSVSERTIEAACGKAYGYFSRVERNALRPHEQGPNWTLLKLLQVYAHNPYLLLEWRG